MIEDREWFDPFAPSLLWYQAWRNHIRCAHANPAQGIGYSQAAAIAQAEYVMWHAIEMVKEKQK